MKKQIKNNIFSFILGGILCSVIVVLADTIAANLVTYDNSNSHSNYNTVQGAIDDLYDISITTGSGLSLVTNNTDSLSKTLEGGLYRYQGTTANNYICFGTTNKNDCIGTSLVGTENESERYDQYMYRIIGVTSDGKMKLIKKEALNDAYTWAEHNNTEWPNASLNTNLNDSYFLTNTTYVPNSSWSNRIAMSDWHYGDVADANVTAAEMATTELGFPTTQAKIGLMYIHDYEYGLPGGNNCSTSGSYNTCKTSWIFLANNDDNWSSVVEHLITRYNWVATNFINNIGYIDHAGIEGARIVRPVFYLTASQVIASGTGTLDDPYILN